MSYWSKRHALLARSREPRCSRRSKMRPPPRSEQCCSWTGSPVCRAWNVELNEDAVLIAHKAVIHICPVNIVSCDGSTRIDSPRVGTLEGAWDVTGVRSIERGERALLIQQEAVTHIVRIKGDSQMAPFGVNPRHRYLGRGLCPRPEHRMW